ncbi:LysR family transcriptional regulator [bacterium]|nr:LysR family transcriptional regulator [bacterium]
MLQPHKSDEPESTPSLDALRYFTVAADCGSFQAAAERLHVTAQAVGKAVASLESRFGLLFVRDKRIRGLTPVGRNLLAEARPLIESFLGLPERVAPAFHSGPKGAFAIASAGSVSQYVLAPLLARLCKLHPEFRPQIFVQAQDAIESHLLSGELDLGILIAPPVSQELYVTAGAEASPVIVAAPEHPPSSWDELGYVVPTGVGMAPPALWPDHQFPRKMLAATDHIEVAIALVEAGLGATVVPHFAVAERLARGRLKIVAPLPFQVQTRLWIAYKTLTPTSSYIMKALLEATQQTEAE